VRFECGCIVYIALTNLIFIYSDDHTRDQFLGFLIKNPSRWISAIEQSGYLGEETHVTQLSTDVDNNNETVHAIDRDDTFFVTDTPDVALSDFLARPILIRSYTWELGGSGAINDDFSAVYEFCQSSNVRPRINNFHWITGKMHLKITVNGTPFHYGKVVMAYEPMPVPGSSLTLRQVLQLPYVAIDPGTAMGGELSYNIIHPFNAVDLLGLASKPLVDTIRIRTLNRLETVAEVLSIVDVNVWAWMTDVHLSCPTAFLVEQSGKMDEYHTNNISAMATTASRSLNHWRDFPMIGKYAVASSMVVKGLGDLAAMFGYSRVSSYPESRSVIPYQVGNLSNCNVSDTSVKLALDGKQEVTIDPRVVGVPPHDEMTLVSLCKREWLVNIVSIPTTITPGTLIAKVGVCPVATIGATEANSFEMSPSTFASIPFENWRGTMYYRLEFIASAFHRGRIRVQYEPSNQLLNFPSIDKYNTTYNHVIDLSESRSYVFCVGWAQNAPYLNCPAVPFRVDEVPPFPNPNLAIDDSMNGIIYLSAVTGITTNTAQPGTEAVAVNIYQYCGDDIAFGNITGRRMSALGLVEQSGLLGLTPTGVSDNDGNKTIELCLNKSDPQYNIKDFSLIHFGEDITSIRQILKRYVLYASPVHVTAISGNPFTYNILLPDFPLQIGPQDMDPFCEPTTITNFNFVRQTYLAWYSLAFMGYRGGIRYKTALSKLTTYFNINFNDLNVTRVAPSTGNRVRRYADALGQNGRIQNTESNNLLYAGRYSSGGVYHNPNFNGALEYELPYNSPARFKPGVKWNRNNEGFNQPYSLDNWHIIKTTTVMTGGTTGSVQLNIFCAAADDFQLYFYKYTPVIIPRVYPTLPAA